MTSIYNFDSLVDRAYNALQPDPTKTAQACQELQKEVNLSTSWFSRFLFWINPFTSIDSRIKAAVRTAQDAIAGLKAAGSYIFANFSNPHQDHQFAAILNQHLGDDRTPAKVGKLWAAYRKPFQRAYEKIAAQPAPPSLKEQFKSNYPNTWTDFKSMLSQMLYHKLATKDRRAQKVFKAYLRGKGYSNRDVIKRILTFAQIHIESQESFEKLYPGLWNGWLEYYSHDVFKKLAEVENRNLDKIYDRILFFNNKGKFHVFLRDKKGFKQEEIDAFLEFAKTQPKPAQSIEAYSAKILRNSPPIVAAFGSLDNPDTLIKAQRIEQTLDQRDEEISDEALAEIFKLSNTIKEQLVESPEYFRKPLLTAHLPLSLKNCIRRQDRIHQLASVYAARRFSESMKDRSATQPVERVDFDKTQTEDDVRFYTPFIQDSHRLCPININGKRFENFQKGKYPFSLLGELGEQLEGDDFLFAQCILSTKNVNAAAEIFTQPWEARPESRTFPMRPVLKELFLKTPHQFRFQDTFILQALVELQLTDPHTAVASHNSPPIASHEALVTYEYTKKDGEWFRSKPMWSLIEDAVEEEIPAVLPPSRNDSKPLRLERIEVEVPDAEAVAELLDDSDVEAALRAPPKMAAKPIPHSAQSSPQAVEVS